MSKKLLAFLVSELAVVRLICKRPGCGVVVEMPVAALAGSPDPPAACPACRRDYGPFGNPGNALARLAQAVKDIQHHAANSDVEFVLPDPA